MICFEAHHTLPQKYRSLFESFGINIDEPGNVVWRNKEGHRKYSKAINDEWGKFFSKSNTLPTKEEVLKFRDEVELKFFKNTNGDI